MLGAPIARFMVREQVRKDVETLHNRLGRVAEAEPVMTRMTRIDKKIRAIRPPWSK